MNEDEREFDRILNFKRRRPRRRIRSWLFMTAHLTAAVLTGLILGLFVLSPAAETLLNRARTDATPSPDGTNGAPTVARVSTVTETPSPTPVSSVTAPASPNPEKHGLPSRGPESPAERPHGASILPQPVRSTIASMPPSAAVETKTTRARSLGLPQPELVLNPASAAEGQRDSYTVRISDTAGQPFVGAEVSLLIRIRDGTVFDIPLASSLEPGTYQGMAPPGLPVPVDLRIRVVTSDTRAEIPLRP
jgi:hypothetical protein